MNSQNKVYRPPLFFDQHTLTAALSLIPPSLYLLPDEQAIE